MSSEDYKWIPFYMEFADKLLEYRYNRKELIDKVLRLWENIDMEMPLLDLNNEIEDMDPFTIFGLFNRKLTDENSISILEYMKNEFNVESEVPKKFIGIPQIMPQMSTFYLFKDKRRIHDIDKLWDIFATAIEYSDNNNQYNRKKFIKSYNNLQGQKGIKWNLTMGLFWIRPYDYLNLDSRSRWFLRNPENINKVFAKDIRFLKNPPTGAQYVNLSNHCKDLLSNEDYDFKNLAELSYTAYVVSVEDDLKDKENNEEGIGDSEDIIERNYWLYSPGYGSHKWDKYYEKGIMGIGWGMIGDLNKYTNKNQIVKRLQKVNHNNSKYTNHALALWQFSKEIKPGDVVFAKKGQHEIIGYGIVESEYFYDETLDNEHFHMLKVNWKEKGHWKYNGTLITKFLTKITYFLDTVNRISNLFESSPNDEEEIQKYPEYNEENFLNEAFISEDDYYTLKRLIKYKKNIILQGVPGVGKTFISKRLAYSLIGFKDKSKVTMVQFHQSYSYEDFIMGYRPSSDGFELTNGVFYDFCKQAQDDEENNYFFIIDEINRGNLSKIFGELFMLLENDKRGNNNKIQLLYNDELFYIPKNVYIIGMMNTADRSLALLDYALRRRFSFFKLTPAFDSDNFIEYMNNLNNEKFYKVIDVIKQLNDEISSDETLGEGFMIGHSYFTNFKKENVNEKLEYVIEYEIIPLLNEYWFDEESKVERWSEKLRSVINDTN